MSKSAAIQTAESMMRKSFWERPLTKRNVRELYKKQRLKLRVSSLKSKFKRKKLEKLLVTLPGENNDCCKT